MNEKKDIGEVVNKELNNKKENIAILKSVNLKEMYSRKCPYTCDCAWHDVDIDCEHAPSECSRHPYRRG